MACWIVVPIKPPGAGKTRLAGVLDDAGRRALVARMLRAVIDAAAGVADARIVLLGASRHGLDDTLRRIDDPGRGLNDALGAALRMAIAERAERVIFLSADLPRVTTAEIAALAAAVPGVIAIAPDRAGRGTNALSLPIPQAADFRFGYGADSFWHHCAEATRLGLSHIVLHRAGLALDIDLPADLAMLAG